ncbi:MAG: tripartite tricarboxylate transporter substrate binding protein [Betaproteobacteria bacterium]
MNRFLARLGSGVLAVAAAWTCTLPAAAAVDYPNRPITLVVPYPPGGPNDVIARTLGPEMSQVLGQPVVIENRPGAGGNLATGIVAKAAADGYTVLLPGIPYAVNPSIFEKVPYTFAEFKPVAVLARGALVLVVHPSLGLKSVAELISAAKAKPGQIAYASGGVGTSPHLAGELFKKTAGVDLLHVPYKGTGDFMSDLLGGRAPVAFVSPLVIRQHVEAGKVVALGVTSLQPLRGMEGVPAIAERGVPGYEAYGWYALLVPAGTPADVIDRLSNASQRALKSQAVQDKLFSLGLDIVHTTPAEADAFIKGEVSKWSRLVKDANIRAE